MISLEVVHLLAEHERPQVFAQELDNVERVGTSRPVLRESLGQALADPVPDSFEPVEDGFSRFLLIHDPARPQSSSPSSCPSSS